MISVIETASQETDLEESLPIRQDVFSVKNSCNKVISF